MNVLPLPWPHLPACALRNAREAMVGLTLVVTDRLALTDSLDATEPDEPGDLHSLTRDECYALLSEAGFGRLAYIARAGVPDIVPVNYALDGDDLLIRSGPGPKLQAAERHEVVAFEVDAVDALSRTGRSVVVVGRAERLRPAEQQRLRTGPAAWAAGPRRSVIRIRPQRVTGRRLS